MQVFRRTWPTYIRILGEGVFLYINSDLFCIWVSIRRASDAFTTKVLPIESDGQRGRKEMTVLQVSSGFASLLGATTQRWLGRKALN
jgi:hypothetical protein